MKPKRLRNLPKVRRSFCTTRIRSGFFSPKRVNLQRQMVHIGTGHLGVYRSDSESRVLFALARCDTADLRVGTYPPGVEFLVKNKT